ncbi:ISLre2 family transposase, partial [Lactobacillus gasseri]|nr:ISLre2 family transposase [Lactobacillus gasseri]
LVKMAGKNIKAGQEADSRYDAAGTKKKVPVLYLEGDGVVIKGTKSRLEFHRYQVCEGIVNISKKRRKRINAKEFVSLSRLDALN